LAFPLALLAIPVPALAASPPVSVRCCRSLSKNATGGSGLGGAPLSWLAWALMVLGSSGLLPIILDELDGIKWRVGGSLLSVRALLQGAATASTLIASGSLSAIESRLLRSRPLAALAAQGGGNATRARR
jgi:hypothetical protein